MNSLLRRYRSLRASRFVQDVLTMQVGTGLYLAATFLSSVLFARVLGVAAYGTYAVVLAFVGTAQVFMNFGQGTALLVFLAEEYGRRSTAGMAAVLKNFLQVSAVNFLLLALLAFFTPAITVKLYGNPEFGQYARILLMFQAVDIGNSMVIITLQALRRIRQKVLFEQGENLSFLSLAAISLFLGGRIYGILLSQLIVAIGFLAIGSVIFLRLTREECFPTLRAILGTPFRSTRQYLRQGILFSMDKNLGNLFPQGLFFVWSLLVPPAVIGIARIAVQLATLPRQILLPSVGELSLTVLAELRAKGMRAIRMNAATVIKHALALQTVMSVGAAIVIPPAILFLYGLSYADVIPVALWLLVLSLPVSLCITNSALLRLLRKIHYSMIQAVISWVLMLAILIWGTRVLGGYAPFILAYGLGQAMPIVITCILFAKLLLPRDG